VYQKNGMCNRNKKVVNLQFLGPRQKNLNFAFKKGIFLWISLQFCIKGLLPKKFLECQTKKFLRKDFRHFCNFPWVVFCATNEVLNRESFLKETAIVGATLPLAVKKNTFLSERHQSLLYIKWRHENRRSREKQTSFASGFFFNHATNRTKFCFLAELLFTLAQCKYGIISGSGTRRHPDPGLSPVR
jgi:hypothetical protein